MLALFVSSLQGF